MVGTMFVDVSTSRLSLEGQPPKGASLLILDMVDHYIVYLEKGVGQWHQIYVLYSIKGGLLPMGSTHNYGS